MFRTKEKHRAKRLINVNQNHIQMGKPKEPLGCPIYLALKDARVPVTRVEDYVFETTRKLKRGVVDQFYDLPSRASRFIKRFDEGKSVKPFSFEINVPVRCRIPYEELSRGTRRA